MLDSTPMSSAESPTRNVFVGIDYHQSTIQVCVLDSRGVVLTNRACGNDWREVEQLAQAHGRVSAVAIEACGGAADLADQLVELAGWSVHLAHAGYVAKLKGSPDKSDFTDAQVLADLTRVGYLPRVWRAPQWVRELRRLVRYRQQLVDQRRSAKLRIRALLRDHRVATACKHRSWTGLWLTWLRTHVVDQVPSASAWVLGRHIEQIDRLTADIQQTESYLREYTKDDRLTSRLLAEPGVGWVTAWVLRSEVGRFDRFVNGKALARFCGLSPRNASSGARQADAGLIKACSPLLRATLIELAHRLGRCEPHWRVMNQHLRDRGKPGSVAAAAVANRWVRGLYYRMTRDDPATPALPTLAAVSV